MSEESRIASVERLAIVASQTASAASESARRAEEAANAARVAVEGFRAESADHSAAVLAHVAKQDGAIVDLRKHVDGRLSSQDTHIAAVKGDTSATKFAVEESAPLLAHLVAADAERVQFQKWSRDLVDSRDKLVKRLAGALGVLVLFAGVLATVYRVLVAVAH